MNKHNFILRNLNIYYLILIVSISLSDLALANPALDNGLNLLSAITANPSDLTISSNFSSSKNGFGSCTAVPSSQACIDATPCKLDSSGLMVCLKGVALPSGALGLSQSCWQYSYEYACNANIGQGGSQNTNTNTNTNGLQNGCSAEQSNPLCSLEQSACISNVGATQQSASCTEYQQTYSCLTKPAALKNNLSCNSGVIQSSTLTMLNDSNASSLLSVTKQQSNLNALVQSATAMEIANEIQTYADCSTANSKDCSNAQLFAGVQESCTKGWAGLKNCCSAQPGAKSNAAMLGLLLGPLASVVKYAGQSAVDSASPYVFDAMYSSGLYTQGMSNAITQSSSVITDTNGLASSTQFSSSGLSFGAYGFTFGAGSAPSASTGLFGANTQLGSLSSSTDSFYVSFNPYVFAGTMALTVLESMQACSPSETLLAMHRGEDLSVYVSQQCNESLPLGSGCVVYQDNYCSFNGVLSKIINQQGKLQLGLDFASCKGLSLAQIANLDFSKLNFTEFANLVTQQAQSNLPETVGPKYLSHQQNALTGSSQTPTNGLTYPITAGAPAGPP